MAQLINEAKRFQQLAGINVKEEYDSNLIEGLNIYLDAIGHNLLLEAEEKQSVLSKILDTPGKALLSLLNVVYNQISPDQQQALKNAIEYISSNNLSKEDIIKSLKGSIAEATLPDDEVITTPSDETKLTAKNPLSNLQRFLKTIPGKISKTIITLLIGFALYGPMIKNAAIGAKDFYNPTKIEQTSNSNNLDVKTGIDKNDYKQADNVGVKIGGKTLSQIDNESNTVVGFVPFKYGKGTMLSSIGDQELQKIIKSVEKTVKDDPDAKIDIKVTGTVSKTTGDVKKGTDTNLPLDAARTKTIVKSLTSYFKNNPNVKISENPNSPDAYKTQTQEKNGGVEGAGAIIKIHSNNTKAPAEPELMKTLEPLRKFKPNEIPVTSDNTPKPTPNPEPSPSPTPVIPSPQFGKLNRNGQIATILATISPELDITKKIGTDSITSYSDKQLMAMPAEAKSIANLIINIRKNPDSLLKRLSTDLGVKLDKRARAITTAVNKNTQAQLQSITEEIISEAAIDDMFSKLGITGEDIKKNEVALLSYLGTMYASEGNNTLSILNPKSIDPDKLTQLKNLGFAPQPGGNYVFLGDQTKKQVKADVARSLNSIDKNKSLVTALKRINNKKELQDLLLAVTQYVNANVKNKPDQMRSDLFAISNKIKMKEAVENTTTSPDVTNAMKIIDSYAGLKSLLNNINDREEFKQFISSLLSYIDPTLFDRKADIKGAVIGVANSLTNTALKSKK